MKNELVLFLLVMFMLEVKNVLTVPLKIKVTLAMFGSFIERLMVN